MKPLYFYVFAPGVSGDNKLKLSSRLRFQVKIQQHVWRRFQEEVIPLMGPKKKKCIKQPNSHKHDVIMKQKNQSQTYPSSDSDRSWMISFTVLDRAPFFEIIDSSFFVKFCKNVCFSFFTLNRILIFVESNFDFPSFFRVNFFFVHFESLKIHAEFSRGGRILCLHFFRQK